MAACVVAVALAIAAVSGTSAGAVPSTGRVVLLAIDAGADWIVDKLLAEGKAPALATLAAEGAVAEGVIVAMPSLTAVSHASLWTGAHPRRTGVTGNVLPGTPAAEHSLLQSRSGYLSPVLRAEPIWTAAARSGRRVLVPQATGGYPFRQEHSHLVTHFDLYANQLLTQEVVRGRIGPDPFRFRVADTEVLVEREGDDAVRVIVDGLAARVTRGGDGYSRALPATVAGRVGLFRVGLLEWHAQSGDVVLLRGGVFQVHASDDRQLTAFLAEAGVAIGERAEAAYRSGLFGRPLADGGDGSAERHLLDAAIANQAYFDGALRFAATQPWDLLVLYVPNMDMLGHALVGMLDPASPRYSPALAAKVWPVYEEGFRRCADGYVGRIRELLPDATLVVTGDHGLEGNGPIFYPNVVLRQAGLVDVDRDDQIDVDRSRAVFLYSHGGGVYVNTTRWRNGRVPEEERAAVKQAAARALLAARDPDTGAPLVRAVFDPDIDGVALGIGGPYAPDLYVDPALGYETSRSAAPHAVTSRGPAIGFGSHGPAPWRRNLHSIFYAAGPLVEPGVRLGMIRTIDIAPTVAGLLGVPPPADAVGLVLPIARSRSGEQGGEPAPAGR
jgi:predicted AlkP superfamily phosphohydrolase/phosphomutase